MSERYWSRFRCTVFNHLLLLIRGSIFSESSDPQPNKNDCKNRTVLANQNGTVHLKPVRFHVKIGEPVRTRVLRSNCKPKGELGVGNHLIVCSVTDPNTHVTRKCSYYMKVKGEKLIISQNLLSYENKCLKFVHNIYSFYYFVKKGLVQLYPKYQMAR